MDKNLISRIVVVAVAAGLVTLGETLCKGHAQMLDGLAGALVGWVIPWFQAKVNGKNEVVK